TATTTTTTSTASAAASGEVRRAAGDRPQACPRESEDPRQALLGWPHPASSLKAGRARDRAETAARHRQAARLPGQARGRAQVVRTPEPGRDPWQNLGGDHEET